MAMPDDEDSFQVDVDGLTTSGPLHDGGHDGNDDDSRTIGGESSPPPKKRKSEGSKNADEDKLPVKADPKKKAGVGKKTVPWLCPVAGTFRVLPEQCILLERQKGTGQHCQAMQDRG